MHLSTVERIALLVSDHLGVEPDEIVPEAYLMEDLGADSVDLLNLMVALEKTFGIEVPDDDVEFMRTIADVQRYVEVHSATGASGRIRGEKMDPRSLEIEDALGRRIRNSRV